MMQLSVAKSMIVVTGLCISLGIFVQYGAGACIVLSFCGVLAYSSLGRSIRIWKKASWPQRVLRIVLSTVFCSLTVFLGISFFTSHEHRLQKLQDTLSQDRRYSEVYVRIAPRTKGENKPPILVGGTVQTEDELAELVRSMENVVRYEAVEIHWNVSVTQWGRAYREVQDEQP